MQIPFHIDQINEILKYLDDVPHKFSRGLVDYFKNHVENHVKQTEAEKPKAETTEAAPVASNIETPAS
jgi:hypothetical protein